MNRLFALLVVSSASLALAESVTLVEAGPNKLAVIKVVSEATGLGLAECKSLVESTPALVKSDLSLADAGALVKKLSDVGARAERSGVKASVGTSREGSWDVVLTAPGPNKLVVIKLVHEATGLGLKDAKDLVESAPARVRRGVSKADAESLVGKLLEAGASAAPSLQRR